MLPNSRFSPFLQRRTLPHRTAFTLVEVLVVVGIVVLLAALLFPAMSSAKRAARSATCQSNLHQIGIALQLYLSDYNRLYPSLNAHPQNCSWSYNMVPYTKSEAVFSCPEDTSKSFQTGCPPNKVEGHITYMFKGAYSFNVPNVYLTAQLSDVRIVAPTRLISVLDGDGDHTGAPPGQGAFSVEDLKTMAVALRHKGGANALFADGHVKWLPTEQLSDRTHWTLTGRDISPPPATFPTN